MTPSLQAETDKLVRSWMRHDSAMLQDYLVADVEDPRLNVASLISRQLLLTAVAGDRFQELMGHELRFAVAMNWLVGLIKQLTCPEDWPALADGLQRGANEAEGIEIPLDILRICAGLPASASGLTVPNYLLEFINARCAEKSEASPPADPLNLFVDLWRQALATLPLPAPPLRVLEAACGSANDYRVLEACGLARLLDYSGFDLCEKNVQNAQAMFPTARFELGNVFDLQAPNRSTDYLFAHDLFEHLSLEGLERAAREVCRVTRQGLCLGFFNMDEIPDHLVRPLADYHWNTLSLDRMRALFNGLGFDVQAVHLGSFIRWATGCDRAHNRNAYTLLLRR